MYFDEFHPTYTMKIALLSRVLLDGFFWAGNEEMTGAEQAMTYLVFVKTFHPVDSWLHTHIYVDMIQKVNAVMAEAKELGLDYVLWMEG